MVPLGCEKEEEERVVVSQGHVSGHRILYTQGQKTKSKLYGEICPSVCKDDYSPPSRGGTQKSRIFADSSKSNDAAWLLIVETYA